MEDPKQYREILRKMDDLESRRVLLSNSVRCLDCTGMNNSIEHVESPIARDQRQFITTLVRKGYTDFEIYQQVSTIFGKHSIIDVRYNDYISKNAFTEKYLKSVLICSSTIVVPIIGFKLFKKFVLKK